MSCCVRCCLLLIPVLLALASENVRGQFDDDPFGGRVQLRERFADDDPFAEPPPVAPASVAAEDDEDDESTFPGQPRDPVDPDVFVMRFHDGMEIRGKPSIDQIQVATSFGTLRVPLEKIHKFAPGLESRGQRYEEIRQWIEQLGAADTALRDQAQAELLGLGLPIRRELELSLDDADSDAAERIRTILEKLDELTEESEDDWFDGGDENVWLRPDIVDTTRFQARGRISPAAFDVTTKYGTITVQLEDLQWLRSNQIRREDASKSLALDGQYLAQLKYKNTGIDVEPGDKISVRAEGQISRAGSSTYVSTPAGSSRFGTFMPSIQGGTLVARLGGKGTVIGVGAKKTFTAKKAGTLQFAIGMRPDYVGRYQFMGEYKVSVKVERAEP